MTDIIDKNDRSLEDTPRWMRFKSSIISYSLMILSCLFWVSGFVYYSDHNFSPFQSSLSRGIMTILVCFTLCRYFKLQLQIENKDRKFVFCRNSVFIIQGFIMTTIQFYLPLSMIHTLGVSGSIFVCIFEYIFQKRKPHISQTIGMAFTLFGILFTANGNAISQWLDPDYQFVTDFQNYKTKDPTAMAICSILFVLFLILWAYAVYSTNGMKASPFVVALYFSCKLYLISAVLYPITLYFYPSRINAQIFYQGMFWSGVPLGLSEAFFILSLFIAESVGMTCMVGAISILIAYFISIFRYGEHPNGFCIIGSFFIVAGLWKIVTAKKVEGIKQ